MKLTLLPDTLAVCRLPPGKDVPQWVWQNKNFLSVTYTSDELCIVCSLASVPAGVQCEPNWRGIKILGPLDFSLTGILASLAVPLAETGIPIFAISTFDTDYILVKAQHLIRAKMVLEEQDHLFLE